MFNICTSHGQLQYTLSIITSQLHCFQLRTILNGKYFKFFLMGYALRCRTSFFNTCMKNGILYFEINMEISFNTKTRLQVVIWSLVFVLMLISIFIDKNQITRMRWRRMFCFSAHSPWEKNLKSFPFKVVLSWKQCSCDVIIERMYCMTVSYIQYNTDLFLAHGYRPGDHIQ
jgi:hypothetical protein